METNEELTPKKSLEIINNMIENTKGQVRKNAFYFLLWGWVTLACCLLHYIFLKFSIIDKPHRAWLIVIVGVIMTLIYNFKRSKDDEPFTHLNKILAITWLVFFISYMIVLFFLKEFNYNAFQLIFILAGNATFVSGVILKFKPVLFGSIVFWIGAILCFYLSYENQLLLSLVVIVFGYLVPGYLLNRKKD
ncbi:hypothetical protein ACFLTE_10240 [Bacteroidota bacterium]